MLQVNHVNTFIGRKRIIKDATFQADTGAIVGLIGPNGAGKTTIMKTILGLTKFTGQISLSNQDVAENDHTALSKVGALIEHPAIYPFLTRFQNLKQYSIDETDLDEVVSKLEMTSYINTKAKGYSMGMKQKLGIALALLNQPQFVILDEPMNGLDIEATILVRKIIKQYAAKGTTFLISSHVLGELQKVMTNVLLINEGTIIVDKSIDDFNQVRRSQYRLLTANMKETEALFNDHQLPVNVVDGRLLIPREQLDTAQDVLNDHHVRLLELIPSGMSFEQTIVDLLRIQRGDRHEA